MYDMGLPVELDGLRPIGVSHSVGTVRIRYTPRAPRLCHIYRCGLLYTYFAWRAEERAIVLTPRAKYLDKAKTFRDA